MSQTATEVRVVNPLHDQLVSWIAAHPAPASSSDDPTVIAKLFDAFGSATWWVTEYDESNRLCFGYVTGMVEDEWGYASLDEMAELNYGPAPRIEVDLYFTPKPFSAVMADREPSEAATAGSIGVSSGAAMSLTDFISRFGDGLLDAVRAQNPPVYPGDSAAKAERRAVMAGLSRQPFDAQADVVQAVCTLLLDRNQPASIINAEMGTGKTIMAVAVAAVMHAEGVHRSLVI